MLSSRNWPRAKVRIVCVWRDHRVTDKGPFGRKKAIALYTSVLAAAWLSVVGSTDVIVVLN